MSRLIDVTGQRFGRLVVVERGPDKIKRCGKPTVQWRCKCDCGNEVIVNGESLRKGHTSSCGCITLERLIKNNTKHNHSSDRLYKVWCAMKNRCYNENVLSYKDYGFLGIEVCDEWKNDYMAFREWAYNNGYDENAPIKECTLDRIDVCGNYCPENCRWANAIVQNNNKHNTVYLTYNGETHSLMEWCRALGIKETTLRNRLDRSHWTIEKALNTPVGQLIDTA